MQRKNRKEIDKIMVQATLEYVFAKKLTGRQSEDFLKPYMGFRCGAVKYAVDNVCPELAEAHTKWLGDRRKNVENRTKIKTDKQPETETDEAKNA
jgi:hypothetical protein